MENKIISLCTEYINLSVKSKVMGQRRVMPRRKELKGIANGLLSSFLSRNNDVDGYWAIGVFYQCAAKYGNNTFELDLLSGESKPYFQYSKRASEPYRKYLFDQMKKKGFEEFQAVKVLIKFEFDKSSGKRNIERKLTWGEPFVCEISLTDDLDRTWLIQQHSWCGQHNPNKETRSTRQYAYPTTLT